MSLRNIGSLRNRPLRESSLPAIEEEKTFNHSNQETEEYRNKTKYALSLIEEGFIGKPINHIPLEAIRVAPDDFFDTYQKVAKTLTRKVQDNLSMSDASGAISKARNNPVLTDERERSLQMINSEFIRYESSGQDPNYMRLTETEKKLVNALVVNEIIGLGPLEPLFQDFSVREIVCNGPYDVNVEIDGSMIKLPCIKFADEGHLMDLITRLFNSVNKEISRTNPLERARLFDNSRVFAVHQVAAPNGPNLNIRRHTELWVDPGKMLGWGTASEDMFSYLGHCVNHGLSILVVGSTGSGKALTYSTPIPTPQGFTTMGELAVGDKVYDKDKNECVVTEIFEQGEKTIYQVELENGIRIESDAEHNWLLDNGQVITTEEMMDSDEEFRIPTLRDIIEHDEIKLPIHPYGLSLYLNNQEIIEESQQSIEEYIKECGIDDIDFIPKIYEMSTIEDREWILKGYAKHKCISSDGIVTIDVTEKTKRTMLRIISSLNYHIHDVGERTISFYSKNYHKAVGKKYPSSYKIKNIVKTSRKENMRCLTVNSPSETFLCSNEHIVTHNTTLLGALTGYIPNNKRVISIERNIELKACPTKLSAAPMEEVPAKAGSASKGITIRDLVEASTQMRPDVIIVGEITGPESYDLLNAANSGHQIFTTIHANSDQDSIYRLITLASQTELIKGKALYDFISAAIDLVVVVERFAKDGSRRITTISEVSTETKINEANNQVFLPVYKIWQFKEDPNSKTLNEVRGSWSKVGELSKERQIKHRIDMNDIPSFDSLASLYKK